jgi:hypothetical protein
MGYSPAGFDPEDTSLFLHFSFYGFQGLMHHPKVASGVVFRIALIGVAEKK